MIATAMVIAAGPSDAQIQVIDQVSVIDVAAGLVRPGQSVVISGRQVTAAGPSDRIAIPAGAAIVDGRDRFLIPGLWDMHVHLLGQETERHALTLFLANGVTGVRDMGAGVDALLRWRPATADGSVPGPRILGAGVLVDGQPHVYPGITHPVTTPDQARHAVDSLVGRGVNFIKAYEMLRPDVFAALADQARLRGIPLAGHLPLAVRPEDAVRAGMRSFEHLRNMEVSCSSRADSLRAVAVAMLDAGRDQPGMPLRASIHSAIRATAYETYDESRCAALIALMSAQQVWHDANLVLGTQQAFRHDTTPRIQRWVPFLAPGQRGTFARTGTTANQRGGRGGGLPPAEQVKRAEWALALVKRMHDAGIRLLAGSDYPNAVMVPGPTVHEELALFVRAGLTPAQALRTATLNPAEYFGMADSLGTVAPGRVAELVLLDGNPLEDIRNVSRVHAVWRAGRHFSRPVLDAMLDSLARPAAR